jgi:hypothetical protein
MQRKYARNLDSRDKRGRAAKTCGDDALSWMYLFTPNRGAYYFGIVV